MLKNNLTIPGLANLLAKDFSLNILICRYTGIKQYSLQLLAIKFNFEKKLTDKFKRRHTLFQTWTHLMVKCVG